jgi:AraC-like DNA-binding protein
MLDHDGKYERRFYRLLEIFSQSEDDVRLAVIHKRKPDLWNVPFTARVLYQHLPPLSDSEIQVLLSQLLKRERLTASPQAIIDAAPYLGGYPPSAYFAAQFARQYGFDALVADKSMLVDFQARRFARFLADLAHSAVPCIRGSTTAFRACSGM